MASTDDIKGEGFEILGHEEEKKGEDEPGQAAQAEREDVKPEREDVKPEREDVKPEREDVKPEREDVKPEREDVKPEGEDIKGEGFEVLDHKEGERPEDVEGRAEARPEGQEDKAEAPTGEGAARAEGEQTPPIDVYSVLKLSVTQLAGVAWQMMGLQPDPFTNQVRKDMDQAHVAIDAAAALIEQLKPHIRGQEARDYENLLTDLRLNFVTHSAEEQKPE